MRGTGHDGFLRWTVSASGDSPAGEGRGGSEARFRSLLRAVDEVVRDTHVQGRFGDLAPAFSAALGSWIEPSAAAMREEGPTEHSRAAARALADLARLTGEYAGQAMRTIAGLQAGDEGTDSGGRGRGFQGRGRGLRPEP